MKRGYFKHILSKRWVGPSALVIFLVPMLATLSPLISKNVVQKTMSITPLSTQNKTVRSLMFNPDYVDNNVFKADEAIEAGMNFDNYLWNDKLETEQKRLEITKLMTSDFKDYIFDASIENVELMFETCSFDITTRDIFITNLMIVANNGDYQATIQVFMLKNLYNPKIINSFNTGIKPTTGQLAVPSYVWVIIAVSVLIIIIALFILVIKSRKKQQDEEIYDFADESEN